MRQFIQSARHAASFADFDANAFRFQSSGKIAGVSFVSFEEKHARLAGHRDNAGGHVVVGVEIAVGRGDSEFVASEPFLCLCFGEGDGVGARLESHLPLANFESVAVESESGFRSFCGVGNRLHREGLAFLDFDGNEQVFQQHFVSFFGFVGLGEDLDVLAANAFGGRQGVALGLIAVGEQKDALEGVVGQGLRRLLEGEFNVCFVF